MDFVVQLASRNDGCLPALMMAGVVFVVGAAVWQSSIRRRERSNLMADVGRRWGGRLADGEFITQPRLEIRIDGIPGEVTFYPGSKSQSRWTRVRFNWGSDRRLRITPQGVTAWLRTIFGGAEIEVGDEDFDAAFWIEGTDEPWAKQVLTPEIRRGILRLNREGPWSTVTIDAGPGGLMLKVSRLLVDDRAALERFIELAVLILREARQGGPVAGVVLAAVETKSGSTCPVCGHPVENPRSCPQCGTPHHEDCWTYMGGCAIFACEARARKAA